jgi:signal transduction histidine kinase/ligand-binding sensor domain-containing protein
VVLSKQIQRRILAINVLLLYACFCIGQQTINNRSADQLNFETIREEDGLSNKTVTSIIQDHYGFMWFATFDGLNRYDGVSFKIFRHIDGDSTSICSNKIESLCEDADGNIWGIGTQLFCYNRATGNFKNFINKKEDPSTIPSDKISKIVKDKNGDLWLNCLNNEFFLFHYNHVTKLFNCFRRKDYSNFPANSQCTRGALTFGDDGYLYLAESGSIIQFHPLTKQINILKIKSFCSEDILYDHKGCIWMDAGGLGIVSVNFLTHGIAVYYPAHNSQITESTRALQWRNDHEIWIANEGNGLWLFNTKTKLFSKVNHLDKLYGLPGEKAFYDICLDRDSTLWFGAHSGIIKLDPQANKFQTTSQLTRPDFKGWKYKIGIGKVIINPLDGNWYIGAVHGEGINIYNPSKNSFQFAYRTTWQNTEALFQDLTIDKTGAIWSTDTKKVYHFKYSDGKAKVSSLALITPQQNLELRKLFADINGNIWIGTDNKRCYEITASANAKMSFSAIEKKQRGYPYKVCNPAAEDSKGNIWFYDYNHFSCFNILTQQFENYKRPYESFEDSSDQFIGLVVDSNDHVWLCDRNHGILEFNASKKTYKLYSLEQGLPHLTIYDMAFDPVHQVIWFYSFLGISSFNIHSHYFATYRITEGLYNGDGISSVSFSKGKLLVGFWDGHISYVAAKDLNINTKIPAIVFTGVSINGEPWKANANINDTNEIKLSYNQNFISFSFTALNYTQSRKNQYAYKLDNVDKRWVKSSTRNFASYSNLSPGKYIFHVKGSNNDGVWNEKGRSITIIIKSAWWQTWLFETALIFSVFVLVFFATRYYFQQKLKLQQEKFEKQKAIESVRSKISMDIHDEISSQLTKISLLSQRMKIEFKKKKNINESLMDKITASSREVINNLGEIVWAINPKYDNLQSLLSYIRNYISNFFEHTSIQYTINFPEEIPVIIISPDLKHNLFLVIKESLNNILKHAEATEVIVRFHLTDKTFCFEIIDNGKGIVDMSGRDFGNGLINMKNRMEAVNGKFEITSKKNKGAKITLKGELI